MAELNKRNDTTKIMRGSDLMLFVEIGGKLESIAFATNHTIQISADTTEISSKDGSGKWQDSAINQMSWTMSTENLYSVGGNGAIFEDLFDAMIARDPIKAVFGLEKDSAGTATNTDTATTNLRTKKLDEVPENGWTVDQTNHATYTGLVVITSLQVNANNGDNATYTAEFTGVGPIKKDGTEKKKS